jgi:hypothetical protein
MANLLTADYPLMKIHAEQALLNFKKAASLGLKEAKDYLIKQGVE